MKVALENGKTVQTSMKSYDCNHFSGPNGGLVNKVDQLILRHGNSRRLTASWLAQKLGISRRHFQRIMVMAVGCTPHRYIITRKMEAIHIRIQEMDVTSVTEAAARSGFSSRTHFTRVFKSYFSECPSQSIQRAKWRHRKIQMSQKL